MSEGRNQSVLVRSFSLSVKNDTHWCVHCTNLGSCGISTHSAPNPVASRAIMVCIGAAVHAQKISHEHDFDKDVWMVVQPTT